MRVHLPMQPWISPTAFSTILIMCWHINSWVTVHCRVWRRKRDTSDDIITPHIHVWFFQCRMFMSRDHKSRRPLMRLLLRRMESICSWIWEEGWIVSETMYMLLYAVMWCRKSMRNDNIWRKYWERFAEGRFVVVGVMLTKPSLHMELIQVL